MSSPSNHLYAYILQVLPCCEAIITCAPPAARATTLIAVKLCVSTAIMPKSSLSVECTFATESVHSINPITRDIRRRYSNDSQNMQGYMWYEDYLLTMCLISLLLPLFE